MEIRIIATEGVHLLDAGTTEHKVTQGQGGMGSTNTGYQTGGTTGTGTGTGMTGTGESVLEVQMSCLLSLSEGHITYTGLHRYQQHEQQLLPSLHYARGGLQPPQIMQMHVAGVCCWCVSLSVVVCMFTARR